jgi:hypothetical protein
MIGGGVRFCRWSVAPLWLGFLGDAEATVLQRNKISPNFFRSPMAIYSDVNGEARETCPGVEADASSPSSSDDVVDPVNLEEDDLW